MHVAIEEVNRMLRLLGMISFGKFLKVLLVGTGLFFISWQLLYMLLLHAGPSVETVRLKVAAAIGVPPVELICDGGCFRRESRALFHQEGNTPFAGEYEEIPPDGQTFEITMKFLKDMNVNVNKDMATKVIKFPMEFDTVFCVICGNERWIIFYGNTVM